MVGVWDLLKTKMEWNGKDLSNIHKTDKYLSTDNNVQLISFHFDAGSTPLKADYYQIALED